MRKQGEGRRRAGHKQADPMTEATPEAPAYLVLTTQMGLVTTRVSTPASEAASMCRAAPRSRRESPSCMYDLIEP